MQPYNRFLDDLAKLSGGALGAVVGLRREIETFIHDRMEAFLGRMDLVTREEFDAVRAMAEKVRDEQEELKARLAQLEAKLAARDEPE